MSEQQRAKRTTKPVIRTEHSDAGGWREYGGGSNSYWIPLLAQHTSEQLEVS